MKIIQKKRLLIGVIIAVIGGIMLFGLNHKAQLEKQVELERNREYEVSLVATLKNTYSGIERISVHEPKYTSIPGSWTCTLEISFNDEKQIKYRVNYSIHKKKISDISLERENRFKDREYLNSKLGMTNEIVTVVYSNGEQGEQ